MCKETREWGRDVFRESDKRELEVGLIKTRIMRGFCPVL